MGCPLLSRSSRSNVYKGSTNWNQGVIKKKQNRRHKVERKERRRWNGRNRIDVIKIHYIHAWKFHRIVLLRGSYYGARGDGMDRKGIDNQMRSVSLAPYIFLNDVSHRWQQRCEETKTAITWGDLGSGQKYYWWSFTILSYSSHIVQCWQPNKIILHESGWAQRGRTHRQKGPIIWYCPE